MTKASSKTAALANLSPVTFLSYLPWLARLRLSEAQ